MDTPAIHPPLRALIAEDERVLAEELRDRLGALWPELEVVAVAEDGVAAIQALHRHRPQIVFLDVQMPGLDGLQVAAQASGLAHVVFVTAFSEHAVAAFEHGAIDYLLKPLSTARLATTVSRLRERLATAPASLEGLLRELAAPLARRPPLRWISVAVGRSMQIISCDEICFFRADNKYTQVVTPTSRPLIQKTIRQLAMELDPDVFLQVHRGTLVNIDAVERVDRDLRGNLSLRLRHCPDRLAVSAPYAHLFRQM